MPIDWAYYSVAVAMLSLFITVLMHMASKGFGLQNLNMWVKSEYLQVGVTFLIILLVGSLVLAEGLVTQIASAVALQSGNIDVVDATVMPTGYTEWPPAEIGKAYLRSVIACEKGVYTLAYTINFYVETWSRVSFDILGVEPLASGLALGAWVTLFHYITNNMVYLALLQYIQYYLLHLSQYAMLYPFLPIGLVLRAFPVTRGAGGLVTAFALGFAFIFPMSYVVVVAVMPGVHGACNQLSGLESRPSYTTLTQDTPCFTSTGTQFENYFKLKMVQNDLGTTIDYVQGLLALLFLQAMIYPLVALTITFTFIRQTSSLFGSDLAEIGRGLLKII